MDRIIDLTFGVGESQCHIICEFYAGGNIIITDQNYKITAVLRTFRSDDLSIAVGETYPSSNFAQLPESVSVDYMKDFLKKDENYKGTIKDYIAKGIPLGLEMIEHVLLKAGISTKMKLNQFNFDESLEKLVDEMNKAIEFASSEEVSKGYIILAKDKVQEKENIFKKSDNPELEFYDRFIPYLFTQYETTNFKEFDSFNEAVDQYYSKLELQRLEKQRIEREINATKKLENVKRDQEKRIKDLEAQEQEYELKAKLIEQNVALVDSIITTINGYLASQISWQVLEDLIKQEKKKGNPMASMIHRLSLDKNIVSIMLYNTDWDDEATEEQNETTVVLVDIDLAHTAHNNVALYFQKKKNASIKRAKTIEAAQLAYKSAEKKAYTELKEVGSKAVIQQIRKPYWFEKFNWFFTSDGYIVVSGRDVQQNELLYKKYLNKGDKYVHADIHGASTCIIKNPNDDDLPPKTLKEAGTLSICHSKGWKNKIVSSAWWVDANQVSKTAPSGEYLSTGSFMIRGKKNFLPPTSLVMGFGILFKLADESIPSHINQDSTEENIRKEKEKKFLEKDMYRDSLREENESQDTEFIQVDNDSTNVKDENVTIHENDKIEAEEIEQLNINENNNEEDNSSQKEHEGEEQEVEEEEDGEGKKDDDVQDNDEGSDEKVEDEDADSKYAINLIRNESDDEENLLLEENQNQQSQDSNRKRKISKHERKRLKRIAQGKPPEPENKPKQQPKQPKPNKETPTQIPRGKRGKLKKIKQKYKYQDEEERRVAMEILASAGTSKKEGKKKEKEEEEQKRKEEYQKKKEFQQLQRERQRQKEIEEEEIRNLLKEENIEMLSEDALQKMNEERSKTLGINMRSFTASPKEGDVLLYAMCVCAPYDALTDYKYKVKVTPGNLKKGKAVKLAMEMIMTQRNMTDVEKELIKAIPESELTRVMISNANIQGAGLMAMINKKKKEKKKTKQRGG